VSHISAAEKIKMNDKAVNTIILCLGDNVLREVARDVCCEDVDKA
ncbi:hypothetical protein A2U01_0076903, partial [Trifolium medium]|nr:hypothetical protein [Trifolium medium]